MIRKKDLKNELENRKNKKQKLRLKIWELICHRLGPQNKMKLILKEKKYANVLSEGAVSGMQKLEKKETGQRR